MERDYYVLWDMFWVFFFLGIQVVYYCDIIDDEILGIVIEIIYGDD